MPVADLAMEFSTSLEAVWTFLREGGVFMICLVALSLLSVAVILYKAIALRAENIIPLQAQEALVNADQFVASGQMLQLIDALRNWISGWLINELPAHARQDLVRPGPAGPAGQPEYN